MKVEKDKVVTFYYTLSEHQGEPLEAGDQIPMAYLHGHGNILPGLEEALADKSVGDELRVVLPPDQAFGERKANAVQRVPIKHLAARPKKLLPNTIVKVQTDSGVVSGQVVKAGKFMVDVDLNHPFAGKTLVFDIKLAEIREGSPEELSHGHAHGTGGHQH